MFDFKPIPFSEEGLENFDRIFGKEDKGEENHEDIIPDSEESGDK